MYIAFSTYDAEGQFDGGVALEIKQFHFHGFTEGGMWIDITHLDSEKERIRVGGDPRPFSRITFGQTVPVNTFTIYDSYPAYPVITKAEYRARFGVGRLLNAQGHFVEQPVNQ